MTGGIRITYPWTADELIRAFRWHSRWGVRRWFRWTLLLLSALWIAAGTFLLCLSSLSHGLVTLLAGLYFPTLIWVIRPWKIRREFAEHPDQNIDIEWNISEEGLHIQSELGVSDLEWNAFAKVVETPEGFLFYPTPRIFNWLPKHGFASDTDFQSVSQLVRQHAANYCQIG